jgi:hypothetical protein
MFAAAICSIGHHVTAPTVLPEAVAAICGGQTNDTRTGGEEFEKHEPKLQQGLGLPAPPLKPDGFDVELRHLT